MFLTKPQNMSYQIFNELHFPFHNSSNDVSSFTYFLQDCVILFPLCPARPHQSSPIHIYIAFNCSFSYLFMVHVSHPYSRILQIYDLLKLFLVLMLKFLFVNIDLFFSHACFAKDNFLLGCIQEF